jgi:hypothetical protein
LGAELQARRRKAENPINVDLRRHPIRKPIENSLEVVSFARLDKPEVTLGNRKRGIAGERTDNRYA